LATFLSLTANAHVYPVTRGQLRNPQHTYVKRAVCQRTLTCTRHSRSSRSSLLVRAEIQNGVSS